MKKMIKLTEGDLHRIVKESVNRVLYNEGLGDSFRGAMRGFHSGANQQMANDEDAQMLWVINSWAQRGLKGGNPQQAMQVLQNIVNYISKGKQEQNQTYGGNLEYNNY